MKDMTERQRDDAILLIAHLHTIPKTQWTDKDKANLGKLEALFQRRNVAATQRVTRNPDADASVPEFTGILVSIDDAKAVVKLDAPFDTGQGAWTSKVTEITVPESAVIKAPEPAVPVPTV